MNYEKLLKKISSKENENKDLTYTYIYEMLNFKPRFYRRDNTKVKEQFIIENFDFILNNLPANHIILFVDLLSKSDILDELIINNFGKIIDKVSVQDENFPHQLSNFIIEFTRPSKKPVERAEIIRHNLKMIIQNCPDDDIFETIQKLLHIEPNQIEFLNNKLETKKLKVAETLLYDAISSRTQDKKYKEEIKQYAFTLVYMIEEILESENKQWIDLQNIGRGSYSNVFAIGDKVIKIGGPRCTYKIPNHRRILQPLIRTNLLNKEENKNIACIEITEKVDANEYNISLEQLYELYKELRDDGIIWTDIRPCNLGRLKKENTTKISGTELDVVPNSVGFDKKIIGEPLKKGDLVILDSDFIYCESDPNIIWGQEGSLAKKFEKRYQEEKSTEISKNFIYREKNNRAKKEAERRF